MKGKEKKKIPLPDGAVPELGQHICVINCPDQADKFVKTTEAAIGHVRKTCKDPIEIAWALENETEHDFKAEKPEPPKDDEDNPIELDSKTPEALEHKMKLEDWMKRI